MKKQVNRCFSTLSLALFLAGCATTQVSPEASRVTVMTSVPSQKYRALGTVSAKVYTLFFAYIRPEEANAALQREAYRRWGSQVDAVIGVQYFEVKGFTNGEVIGTIGTGTAVQYER